MLKWIRVATAVLAAVVAVTQLVHAVQDLAKEEE
jgi:uncharacterized membrane protein YidH (DUF202 family)